MIPRYQKDGIIMQGIVVEVAPTLHLSDGRWSHPWDRFNGSPVGESTGSLSMTNEFGHHFVANAGQQIELFVGRGVQVDLNRNGRRASQRFWLSKMG